MSNMLELNPNGSVTLCARKPRGCCPVMQVVDENTVKITDDYGNSVIMSTEQASLIGQGAQLLEAKDQPKTLLCD